MLAEYRPLRVDDGRVVAYCTCGWCSETALESPDKAALSWDDHARREHW